MNFNNSMSAFTYLLSYLLT